MNQLAAALRCPVSELLDATPPNRRAALEVTLSRMQEDPQYVALGLPLLRPSARLDDATLEHLVALFSRVQALFSSQQREPPQGTPGARIANAAMRLEMRRRDNYFGEIERSAGEALSAVDYRGPGTVSERNLTDLAAHFGFSVARVQDLPSATRSITDMR
ncbi:MAG TPA: hypothetical protein VG368_07385, partial [Acidimicrobiales bacterium]|nr:hypothetical protein [Acidimicrobiales bacterium]